MKLSERALWFVCIRCLLFSHGLVCASSLPQLSLILMKEMGLTVFSKFAQVNVGEVTEDTLMNYTH